MLHYSTKIKSNDPTQNPLVLKFKTYNVKELCMYGHLKKYLTRGELAGAAPVVFATTKGPHVVASQETLSRYVRLSMGEAGIDIHCFTPYICGYTSISAAMRRQVSVATIMTAAGWTGETTFRRPVSTNTAVTNLIPATRRWYHA